jgi:hypothetical protein
MAGLKFRVLLDTDNNTEIFRDILINDTDNFEVFYKAIIQAFNFQGDQMASIYVSNDNWDKGFELNLMDMTYGDEQDEVESSIMKDVAIKTHLEEPDQKFILVYDFMRMWIFLIELVGYEKEGPAIPKVLVSVGMAPPEDSRDTHDVDELFLGTIDEDGFDEDEDEFGDDFEDGYADEDYENFDQY